MLCPRCVARARGAAICASQSVCYRCANIFYVKHLKNTTNERSVLFPPERLSTNLEQYEFSIISIIRDNLKTVSVMQLLYFCKLLIELLEIRRFSDDISHNTFRRKVELKSFFRITAEIFCRNDHHANAKISLRHLF